MAKAGEYAAPVDPKEGAFQFDSFHGLRNNVTAETFLPGDLVFATNCDIDDALNIHRRKGYSAPVTASVDRDLWASGAMCLAVGSNALKRVDSNYATTTLRVGLAPSRPLSYAAMGDRVFYSNGAEMGCIQGGVHRTWGLTVPGMPMLSSAAGTMNAGLYQVAVTYLRLDGQESGAGRAATITLAVAGGIALSNVPVSADPTVAYKAVYVTAVGGETLYRAGVIANADTTFSIQETRPGVSPLLTQFLSPPPAGDYIGVWKGWMLVAKDDRLYVSEPYAPELFDLRKSYSFGERITMLAPLHDKADTIRKRSGIWIGTDNRIIWEDGESPELWSFKPAANYGVIPGTLAYADGELIGDGSLAGNMIAMFTSKRGICVGHADGNFTNMTQARYAFPSMDRGAGIVRRHRGIAQYMTTLQGTAVAGNVAT